MTRPGTPPLEISLVSVLRLFSQGECFVVKSVWKLKIMTGQRWESDRRSFVGPDGETHIGTRTVPRRRD